MHTVASTSTERWWPIEPPLSSVPGARSPAQLDAVLDALSVETNPRYAPANGLTYCSTYVWDATRCMGVEIPHWVDGQGQPAPSPTGATEMRANAMHAWLGTSVAKALGWRLMGPRTAQENANRGSPTVVTWCSLPGGTGHVAMVTPAAWSPITGPIISQAGATNFRRGSVGRGFGSRIVSFWGAP